MLKVKGKEKIFVNIGSLISAFAAVFSANKILADGSFRLSDSVMSVILFACVFCCYKICHRKMSGNFVGICSYFGNLVCGFVGSWR